MSRFFMVHCVDTGTFNYAVKAYKVYIRLFRETNKMFDGIYTYI